MKTMDRSEIGPELLAAMEEAVERAENAENQGRDLERIRKARESMNRIREEIRRDHGILDIGVLAIRELRDS